MPERPRSELTAKDITKYEAQREANAVIKPVLCRVLHIGQSTLFRLLQSYPELNPRPITDYGPTRSKRVYGFSANQCDVIAEILSKTDRKDI